MEFVFTDQADAWFDKEPSENVRALVVHWLHELLHTSPSPDDWIGVPLEDAISRVAFLDECDVVITYMPWPEGQKVFVDMIEPIPGSPLDLPGINWSDG